MYQGLHTCTDHSRVYFNSTELSEEHLFSRYLKHVDSRQHACKQTDTMKTTTLVIILLQLPCHRRTALSAVSLRPFVKAEVLLSSIERRNEAGHSRAQVLLLS